LLAAVIRTVLVNVTNGVAVPAPVIIMANCTGKVVVVAPCLTDTLLFGTAPESATPNVIKYSPEIFTVTVFVASVNLAGSLLESADARGTTPCDPTVVKPVLVV
jgi:hypothetical protein